MCSRACNAGSSPLRSSATSSPTSTASTSALWRPSCSAQLGSARPSMVSRAGLFFLSYCLFEIPSNLILERVGARRWIARIMIGWGLVSMAHHVRHRTARVHGRARDARHCRSRLLPRHGAVLTYWIPASERARTGALFMMAAPDGGDRRRAGLAGAPEARRLARAPTAGSGCSSSKASPPSSSASGAQRPDRSPRRGPWLSDDDRDVAGEDHGRGAGAPAGRGAHLAPPQA